MKISRQVGTTGEVLGVYAQDATVSTGAGLANIVGSTVNFSFIRNNQAAYSTGIASTAATTGTYSTSGWTQVHSSQAKGFYQFGVPDGLWASGGSALLLIYGSTGAAASMAPIAIEVELTKDNNQQYASSTVYSSTNVVQSVTGLVGASTITSLVGVSTLAANSITFATYSTDSYPLMGVVDAGAAQSTTANTIKLRSGLVTTSSNIYNGHTILIYSGTAGVGESRLVTSWSAANTTAGVDTWDQVPNTSANYVVFGTPPGSNSTPTAVNLLQIYGSPAVTTSAGTLGVSATTTVGLVGVSSITIPIGVSTITVGVNASTVSALVGVSTVTATTAVNLLQVYGSPVVTTSAGTLGVANSGLVGVSTITVGVNATTVSGAVNVTSFQGSNAVTTSAGVLGNGLVGVSTVTVGVNASTVSVLVGVSTVTATTAVNLMQVYGSPVVTTSAGTLGVANSGLVGVSTITVGVNVTSIQGSAAVTTSAGVLSVGVSGLVGVSTVTGTTNVNLLQVYGSPVVTTSAGTLGVANSGLVGVSTITLSAASSITQGVNVTSGTLTVGLVGVSSMTIGVNVTSVQGSAAVTSSAGVFANGLVGVSTMTIGVNATTVSGAVNLTQIYGSPAVTTSAGTLGVSASTTVGLVGVSSMTAGAINLSAYSSDSYPLFGIVDLGTAQSTTINSIKLRSGLATTSSNIYNGHTILIYSGNAGVGESRIVTSWSDINTTAGVDDWDETPNTSAKYVVFGTPPGSQSDPPAVNLVEIYGSPAITTSAGRLGVSATTNVAGLLGVSTIVTLVGVSTITVGVNSTTNSGVVNLTSIYGSPAVTTSAGTLGVTATTTVGLVGVSSMTIGVNVTSVQGSAVATTVAGVLSVGVSTISATAQASLANTILTTTQAEGYRTVNAQGSVMQLMYETVAHLGDFANVGTTKTLHSVTSHAGGVATYGYDSSTSPSSITRTS